MTLTPTLMTHLLDHLDSGMELHVHYEKGGVLHKAHGALFDVDEESVWVQVKWDPDTVIEIPGDEIIDTQFRPRRPLNEKTRFKARYANLR